MKEDSSDEIYFLVDQLNALNIDQNGADISEEVKKRVRKNLDELTAGCYYICSSSGNYTEASKALFKQYNEICMVDFHK